MRLFSQLTRNRLNSKVKKAVDRVSSTVYRYTGIEKRAGVFEQVFRQTAASRKLCKNFDRKLLAFETSNKTYKKNPNSSDAERDSIKASLAFYESASEYYFALASSAGKVKPGVRLFFSGKAKEAKSKYDFMKGAFSFHR